MKKLNKKLLFGSVGALAILGSVAAVAASCSKVEDKDKDKGKKNPGTGTTTGGSTGTTTGGSTGTTTGGSTGTTTGKENKNVFTPMPWSNDKNAPEIAGSTLFIVPQPPLGQHVHPDGSVHGHVHSVLKLERQAHDLVVTKNPTENINLADPVPSIAEVRINFVSEDEANDIENKFDSEGNAGLYEKDGKIYNAKGEEININVNKPKFYYDNMNNVRLLTNIPGFESNIVTFTKEDVDRGYLIAKFSFTHGLPTVAENLFEKQINYFYVNRLQFLHYHNDQIGDHWEVNLANLPRVTVKYEVEGKKVEEFSELDSKMIEYRGILDGAREAMTWIHPDRRFKFEGKYGHMMITLNTQKDVHDFDGELKKDANGKPETIGGYTFWEGRFPKRGKVTWVEKVSSTAPKEAATASYALYANPYSQDAAGGKDIKKGNLYLWNEFVKTAVELDHLLNVEAPKSKMTAELDKKMAPLAQKLAILTQFIDKYRDLDVVGDEVYGYTDEYMVKHVNDFGKIPGQPNEPTNIFQTEQPNDAEKMYNAVLNAVLALNSEINQANIDYTKPKALNKGLTLIQNAVDALSARLEQFKAQDKYVDDGKADLVTPPTSTPAPAGN
ncbi:hypothetical protein OF375_00410 [Ureaplasma miroungigenitalium]|uniref:Vmc-like lipoprotein signal peptide domain-containing protein n=1 Tax=Ureaplasma miroungigenitalium TaxID=1042321 RepID=UPI0021E8D960|nr:hypothetical protein [Ureaplasma miroungigenitalium]MCV3734056.1 hypothetical protein [Ureaplasma miroungigenitalium]